MLEMFIVFIGLFMGIAGRAYVPFYRKMLEGTLEPKPVFDPKYLLTAAITAFTMLLTAIPILDEYAAQGYEWFGIFFLAIVLGYGGLSAINEGAKFYEQYRANWLKK